MSEFTTFGTLVPPRHTSVTDVLYGWHGGRATARKGSDPSLSAHESAALLPQLSGILYNAAALFINGLHPIHDVLRGIRQVAGMVRHSPGDVAGRIPPGLFAAGKRKTDSDLSTGCDAHPDQLMAAPHVRSHSSSNLSVEGGPAADPQGENASRAASHSIPGSTV